MKGRIILVFLALIVGLQSSLAQETLANIDSIKQVLRTAPADTSKAILLQKVGGHYNVVHLDSARAFLEEGLALSEQLDFDKGRWINLNTLGNYFERKTQLDSAMYFYDRALQIVEATNSTKGYAVVLNNIATIHIRKGDYEEALTQMFAALEAEEELQNQNGIAQAYNNIGVVYYYLQDFEKTTDYLTRALVIQEELGNYDGLINGYNNVGAIQDYLKEYDEAIVSYGKGLEISRTIGDRKKEAIQLVNIGLAQSKKGNYSQAEEFLSQSLEIRYEIEDYNGMASAYNAYAENALAQGKTADAKDYFERSLEISEVHGLKLLARESYRGLSNLYSQTGDYKNANDYLNKLMVVKDSILNENNAQIIAEVETKYETEKKEKEIQQQRAQLAEQELKVKKKNTLIYGSLSLAFVLGLLGYLLYNQQRLKNRQIQKESELRSALAKIETQNKLQEQRLRISRDLHDNIGSQLTFIISSIDNLKFGFADMGEKLSDKLSGISSFTSQTIYELRDTIWAMNKQQIDLEDLQARISNFIEKASAASGRADFQFEIDPALDANRSFSSVVGMNIYRVIQEAVNNAMKYASASAISVRIDQGEGAVLIGIQDNGKGFDPDQVELGNGLNNMKKRARDIGGALEIQSDEQKGTRIVLSVPDDS